MYFRFGKFLYFFFVSQTYLLGAGFSGKFRCDGDQGYVFEQFFGAGCKGTPNGSYRYPHGCSRFIGASSFFLEKCGSKNNSTISK